ncbi:MAG: glycosyl hydrolase family 65 protein [bacterium]
MKRDSMYRSLESDGQAGNRLAKPPPEEPDAGNLHVRVCEGLGRKRPSLLGKHLMNHTLLAGLAALITATTVWSVEPKSTIPMPGTSRAATAGFAVLKPEEFRHYAATFNQSDRETVTNHIPNAAAWDWMAGNVPLLDCPDKEIEEIYYFRWWTYRKHIKQTPDGFVVTEFLPQVGWSKKHNTINGSAPHHLYEGRWIHDPNFLDDYTRFYFGKAAGSDPGGVSKCYSEWFADAIYARYLVNADKPFVTCLLDALVKNNEAWNRDGAIGDAWQKSRLLENGLFWQIDSWEATEFSIGGTGIRPPINSYMFGNAVAISRIAELADRKELAGKYRAEADQLRKRVQDQLWDPEAKFFNVMRHEKVPTNQYGNSAAEDCAPGKRVKVREIFGYVPWYFNLPEDDRGYEEAWRQLSDPQGFLAPYGPTVAERRHPNFKINSAGCEWRGASWPFSTAQTLTALANLLNNYHQNVLGKKDYFDTLKTYTRSHRLKAKDGVVVPWIDESLNPDTGAWIRNGDRGANYNHSTYCDLVISGLVGLRPRADDIIEVNPLVPDGTWDYFCLDGVLYHGRNITILYDKTGRRYGKGKGLQVLADGRRIAGGDKLQRLTARLPDVAR